MHYAYMIHFFPFNKSCLEETFQKPLGDPDGSFKAKNEVFQSQKFPFFSRGLNRDVFSSSSSSQKGGGEKFHCGFFWGKEIVVIVFQEFLFRENALLLSRPRRNKIINKLAFCFEYMPPTIVLVFFADHINKLKIKLHALVQIFKKIIIKTSFYSIFPSSSHVHGSVVFFNCTSFFLSTHRNNCSQTRHFSEQQKNSLLRSRANKGSVFSHTWKNNLLSRFFDADFFISFFTHAAALGAQISTESWMNLALEFAKNSFVSPQIFVQHYSTNITWHLEHFQNCSKVT